MRILLLNQCFYPDHVATAQYLTDLALGLKEAGHEVTVVASSRGYDSPLLRFPIKESWRGIDIHRIWTLGLGKKAKWRRYVDFTSFWISAIWILLRLPRFDVTVCLTSPPLISALGTFFALLKGGKTVPWIMDLNPDEAVAAGWLREGSFPVRTMDAIQRWSFRRAARIIALDRFMSKRLIDKGVSPEVIYTAPPWSHDDVVRFDAEGRGAFRAAHGLTDKFVVMYSGNHSPCHPLDTLLEAALSLREHARLHFLFVGGGSEFEKVQAFRELHGLANITTLGYQPMSGLAASLSAADLHTVVLGAAFVGLVHPCKIYNILALGIPFLTIGPDESHLQDLAGKLSIDGFCWNAKNGDVSEVVRLLTQAAEVGFCGPSVDAQKLAKEFSLSSLRFQMIQMLEEVGK